MLAKDAHLRGKEKPVYTPQAVNPGVGLLPLEEEIIFLICTKASYWLAMALLPFCMCALLPTGVMILSSDHQPSFTIDLSSWLQSYSRSPSCSNSKTSISTRATLPAAWPLGSLMFFIPTIFPPPTPHPIPALLQLPT